MYPLKSNPIYMEVKAVNVEKIHPEILDNLRLFNVPVKFAIYRAKF